MLATSWEQQREEREQYIRDRIGLEPQCDCDQSALRWRIQSNAVKVFVRQCTRCGRNRGNVSKTSSEVLHMGHIDEWDQGLQDEWNTTRTQYWTDRRELGAEFDALKQQESQEARNEAQERWWKDYNDYLKTPLWKHKRQMVMQRAGSICEGCHINKATQVHHLTYDHVGNELLFELVAICDGCHLILHPHMER